jgi:hypothetical protein
MHSCAANVLGIVGYSLLHSREDELVEITGVAVEVGAVIGPSEPPSKEAPTTGRVMDEEGAGANLNVATVADDDVQLVVQPFPCIPRRVCDNRVGIGGHVPLVVSQVLGHRAVPRCHEVLVIDEQRVLEMERDARLYAIAGDLVELV